MPYEGFPFVLDAVIAERRITMSKRIVALLLSVAMLLCLIPSALAITGSECDRDDVEFRETGEAIFLLDENGRVCGVLKPNEDLKKVGFQNSKHSSPRGLEDGKALRRRVFVRVNLDDELKVIKGGRKLQVTITLTNADLVREVVGEELTVESIIDATIYSPNLYCDKPYAAHMFLPQGSGRELVGTVSFCNGTCLKLYVGNFDCDCELELGFTAVANKAPAPKKQETPCQPQQPCQPQPPCNPCVTVTTTTTTEVTTTTTTTTTVGSGCKK